MCVQGQVGAAPCPYGHLARPVRRTEAALMLHILRAAKETVHWGYFDAALGPALKVKSGDHIHVQAITHHAGDAPDLMMDHAIRQLYRDIPEDDRNPGVHIMTGPIQVEAAKPGDMLEVRYLSMSPRFRHGSNLT